MSREKTIIQATPPSLVNQNRVDFDKPSFDAIIEQKGYEVVFEKRIECPCASEENSHPQSNCKNCGATGHVFVNPTNTRMIMHSQNINTKYREWSEEKLGTASITARDEFNLSFMDKITLQDGRAVYSERLYPKEISGETYAFTFYPMEIVEVAYQFVDSNTQLVVLKEGEDFTVSDNIMSFADNTFADKVISVRYIHKPSYFIIDLPRELMMTPIKNINSKKEEDIMMPIHGMVRRAHFVIDAENRSGSRLFDNSYLPETGSSLETPIETPLS
tara:strand:- start:513 stop:1334 length:822 start_codon:yes stop_codon:yes gene_type:complete